MAIPPLLFVVSWLPSLFAPRQKFDYDSSSVRKRFFREALLQIFIPYMLKQLGPSCVCVSLLMSTIAMSHQWTRVDGDHE